MPVGFHNMKLINIPTTSKLIIYSFILFTIFPCKCPMMTSFEAGVMGIGNTNATAMDQGRQ